MDANKKKVSTRSQATKRKHEDAAMESEPRAKRCQIVMKRIDLTEYRLAKPTSLAKSSLSTQPSQSVTNSSSSAKQSSSSQPPSFSQPSSSVQPSLAKESSSAEQSQPSSPTNFDSSTDDEEFDIAMEIEEETEEEVVEKAPKKKVGQKATYVFEKVCKDYAEAEADLKARNFGRTDSKKVGGGMNHFFRCKEAIKDGKTKCPSKMRISESDVNGEAKIYSSVIPHDHDGIAEEDKSKRMSQEMRNFIVSQHKKHMRAKDIIKSIDEMKMEHNMFTGQNTPNAKQIYYIAEQHALVETPPIISVGDLVQWCQKNASIPLDEDKAYVIGYEHSNEDDTRFFRFVVSTQRLLKHSVGASTLCVDGTYKLNWQGYPFLIVGTVDRSKKFHALAYACVTNETTLDYAFFFQTLIDAVKLIHNKQLNPKTLIADGDLAIRNAFASTFANVELMIMCYVHVQRNINKRHLANAKNNRKAINADIDVLHLAANEAIFDDLSALFIKKWQKKEADFTRYFEQQWLGELKYWFVGASLFDPSDNNHIEGYNSHVKRDVTFRERMPLAKFSETVLKMASDLSSDYKNKTRCINNEPTIPKALWVKSAIWAKDTNIPTVKISENASEMMFFAPSTKWVESEKAFDLDAVEKLQQMAWKTFDQYVEFGHGMFYTVKISKDTQKWQFNSQCDCPDFFKHYMCKHVVGIAMRRKIAALPATAIPTLLSQNRKAGRPTKSTKALLMQ